MIWEPPDFKEPYERERESSRINIRRWENLAFHGHVHCSLLGNKSNKSSPFSILISSARHRPFLGHKSHAHAFTTSIIHGEAFCATGGAPQVIIVQT